MSIGYIFTKCRDGKYYRGLIYVAPKKQWFICFDEDEPLELVMRKSCPFTPKDILTALGITYSKAEQLGTSYRYHGNHLRPSKAYFLTVDNGALFPTPTAGVDEWDEVYEKRPQLEGTYFGCRGDI